MTIQQKAWLALLVGVLVAAAGLTAMRLAFGWRKSRLAEEDEHAAGIHELLVYEPEPEPAREPGRHRLVVPTIGDCRRDEWNRESGEWRQLLAAHAAESYVGRDFLRRRHDIVPPTEAARMLAEAVA